MPPASATSGTPALIRPAAMAGRFYPRDPTVLRRDITAYLEGPRAQIVPKALVVPHAGYMYSGRVAGVAYRQIAASAAAINRVVLLGPSHQLALAGLALPAADVFETPLGRVTIDADGRRSLCSHPSVVISGRAHEFEHSLEVQLPFLQTVLGSFSLLPLVAGSASASTVAEVLDRVWGGPETLLVISTDLSHYHDDASAKTLDERTSGRILALDASLCGSDACGCVGLNGFLLAAKERGLRPRELARCTSGDVCGDKSRVVGYGAYAFYDD